MRAALALTRDDPIVTAFGGFAFCKLRWNMTPAWLWAWPANENPNSAGILLPGGRRRADWAATSWKPLDFLQRGPTASIRMALCTYWQMTGMAHIRMSGRSL